MSGCQVTGEGKRALTTDENRVSLWNDGNVFKLDSDNDCHYRIFALHKDDPQISGCSIFWGGAFPGSSTVKNLPVMQETGVPSLGQEDSLEKGISSHSSILAWSIPWRGA